MAVPKIGRMGNGATEEDSSLRVSPSTITPTSSVPWSLSSPFIGPPSPLMEPAGISDMSSNLAGEYDDGLIKIGQTGLHNPGGRSSSIGL